MTSPLADRVLSGDTRAIARAISLIEDDDPGGVDLIRAGRRRANLLDQLQSGRGPASGEALGIAQGPKPVS